MLETCGGDHLDNLNTHKLGALYEAFDELSVFSRGCLNRRISAYSLPTVHLASHIGRVLLAIFPAVS